jgi:Uma2 family endonuclease
LLQYPKMSQPSSEISLVDQQHIVLDFISWDFYEHLLEEVADRPIRITYDSGSVEIMAPLGIHEDWKSRIGLLIAMMCVARDIEFRSKGSITLRWKLKEKGLEPDDCYYIQNVDTVRSKSEIDLTKDPPPDLAIEIDITSRSIAREPIYAAFGVPELWRFDGKELTVLWLDDNSRYVPAKSSRAFPFLPMDEFDRFLRKLETERNVTVLNAFRDWVARLP